MPHPGKLRPSSPSGGLSASTRESRPRRWRQRKHQFLGYRSPQYRKAENNTDKLAAKECQKLKDCIDAALASSEGVQYAYDGFNQSKGAGRTKICVHYFRIEKAKK